MKTKSIIALLIVSCLVSAVLPGMAIAESSLPTEAVEQEVANPIELMYTKDYAFDYVIPGTGTIYSTDSYTMTAGKYCLVERTDSVNKSAVFRVVDASTLTPLGDWVTVWNGSSATIYTNTSGSTKTVKIQMSSNNIFQVHVQGWFKFGEF